MSEVSKNPKLVMNIRAATPSDVNAFNGHGVDRDPDGWSEIDLSRTHLNRLLVGLPEGPNASMAAFYKSGVKRATHQAEAPYIQMLISASPEYFRPDDPEAHGTWDPERMEIFVERAMAWANKTFGSDLVYASLHLDERTPHLHTVIAPTYGKKARKPGRQRQNETDEEFAARVAAAASKDEVRTVGRSSHPILSKKGSFTTVRKSLALAVADLGIEYGKDRSPKDGKGITTREWVKRQAVNAEEKEKALNIKEEELGRQEEALEEQKAEISRREEALKLQKEILEKQKADQDQREVALDEKDAALTALKVSMEAVVEDLKGKEERLKVSQEELQIGLADLVKNEGLLVQKEKALDLEAAQIRDEARKQGWESGFKAAWDSVHDFVEDLKGELNSLRRKVGKFFRPLRAIITGRPELLREYERTQMVLGLTEEDIFTTEADDLQRRMQEGLEYPSADARLM